MPEKNVTKSQNVIDIRLKYSKFDHNIGFVLGSQCGLYQSVARTFAPQSWQALQLRSASRFMQSYRLSHHHIAQSKNLNYIIINIYAKNKLHQFTQDQTFTLRLFSSYDICVIVFTRANRIIHQIVKFLHRNISSNFRNISRTQHALKWFSNSRAVSNNINMYF